MNKESVDYICGVLNDSESLYEDLQCFFNSNKVSNEKTLVFLSLVSDYLEGNNKLDNLLNIIKSSVKDQTIYLEIERILKENMLTIKQLNREVENKKLQTNSLIDIEWKFIGSASLEQAENQVYEPRIIMKLLFSDGSFQVIETDFGNFKKLQEEFELAGQSYGSTYSRKLMAFSK